VFGVLLGRILDRVSSFKMSEFHLRSRYIRTAEHAQITGSLPIHRHCSISFAIAVGGIRPALLSGCLKPSKMPGRPKSRGRLSLNSYNRPPTKHQKRKNGRGWPPPEKIFKKKKRGGCGCLGLHIGGVVVRA